uniref:RNase H type-1 domain-containing protein n=1 Tax=Acrobeloides nanus TaxID=290746 RepID=A0A914D198_9BILA
IYTDASFNNKFILPAISGYYGPNHPLNFAHTIYCEIGSAGAEVIAARLALSRLLDYKHYNNEHVVLKSDYNTMVNAMNNGFKDKQCNGEFLKLRKIAEKFPTQVLFQYVPRNSDQGIRKADAMAKRALKDYYGE